MPRITKEYEERKTEILDCAQKLFYEQGYNNTSVNTIIETIGVSKGTFYHYFKSKEELLNSLVDRLGDQILDPVNKILNNPSFKAVDKLNKIFETSKTIKSANREFILAYAKVVTNPENLVMMDRLRRKNHETMVPIYAKVIRQGKGEGIFNTPYPADAADIIVRLGNALVDVFCELLLTCTDHPENIKVITHKAKVYENTVERILGAPHGSIDMVDEKFYKVILGGKS
jgi:AcrR family transcriptional regulator